MPEMPEVDAVCRRLREQAEGASIERCRLLRPSIASGDIESASRRTRLERVERRGKNILLHLSSRAVIHIHLRMTGNLYVVADHRFLPVAARAVWELSDKRGIVFEDPRALGRLQLLTGDSLPVVGWDPLDPSFTPEVFASLCRGRRTPAKTFLLDQQKVAGLGNIYAAEALFRAGIDPRRSAGSIAVRRLRRLHEAIVQVMSGAVETVYSLYSQPGQLLAAEQQSLQVYGREGNPCRTCGRPIRRIVQSGRSTYYCPRCQR